ncbi:MAG: hypothetical protein LBS81_03755 [Endomicrobium sp.]|jgi:putative lipoic acid-binding regulatory protein|nr:hypothetical protein [Endomicrobium sp.]
MLEYDKIKDYLPKNFTDKKFKNEFTNKILGDAMTSVSDNPVTIANNVFACAMTDELTSRLSSAGSFNRKDLEQLKFIFRSLPDVLSEQEYNNLTVDSIPLMEILTSAAKLINSAAGRAWKLRAAAVLADLEIVYIDAVK